MTLKTVKEEIERFLSSDDPEVMAIKGSWGVGKTYTWNKFFKEAKDNKEIKLKTYSYVSLFGINSFDSLKRSIFEQSISVNSSENRQKITSNATIALKKVANESPLNRARMRKFDIEL